MIKTHIQDIDLNSSIDRVDGHAFSRPLLTDEVGKNSILPFSDRIVISETTNACARPTDLLGLANHGQIRLSGFLEDWSEIEGYIVDAC